MVSASKSPVVEVRTSPSCEGKSFDRQNKVHKSDLFLVFGFCSVIAIVAVLTWLLSPEQVSDAENRELVQFPKLHRKKIAEFPPQFEAYLNDRIAFRQTLVQTRNLLKYKLFNVSTGSDVAIGKNDFLFFLGEGMERLCKVEHPLTSAEVDDWVTAIIERQRSLKASGIKYLFVVAPEKPSVYPELLPPILSPLRATSCVDQIKLALEKRGFVDLVDLRAPLLNAKRTKLVYLKTDTHWNDYGALIGYQCIMNKLSRWFPNLEPSLTERQVAMQMLPHTNGDCPKLMGLARLVTEMAPKIGPEFRNSCPAELLDSQVVQTDHERTKTGDSSLPSALVLHDSFGFALKPYLYRHFKQVHFQRETAYSCDGKLIEKYKPDVVVQILVERRLLNDLPFHSRDWRSWLKRSISHSAGTSREWLSILPNDKRFNVHALERLDLGPSVNPTTVRLHTKSGDEVRFTAESALWFEWYLLKDGNQGSSFASESSKRAYGQLQDFVRFSGHFRKAGEFVLPNKEILHLYKRNAPNATSSHSAN